MKKIIFLLFILITGKLSFAQSIQPGSRITYQNVDNNLKQLILNYISRNDATFNSYKQKNQNADFDFEQMKKHYSDGVWTNIVVCPSKNIVVNNIWNPNDYNGEKTVIGFVLSDNGSSVIGHHVSKTVYEEKSKSIEMYNNDLSTLYSVSIDTEKQKMETTWVSGFEGIQPGCGQRTANCISYHYSQNGWWSVGLGILTAVAPGTSVAVAAACALTCCTNSGCPGN